MLAALAMSFFVWKLSPWLMKRIELALTIIPSVLKPLPFAVVISAVLALSPEVQLYLRTVLDRKRLNSQTKVWLIVLNFRIKTRSDKVLSLPVSPPSKRSFFIAFILLFLPIYFPRLLDFVCFISCLQAKYRTGLLYHQFFV